MFGGKAKQYPNLVNYLHQASRPPSVGAALGALPVATAIWIGTSWAVFSGIMVAVGHAGMSVPAAFVAASLGVLTARGTRPAQSPQDARQAEARATADLMRKLLDLRRLHRDLDEASLTLLEECARHWSRIQSAFSTGFWVSEDLPPAYQSARDMALRAADEGMEDILLLYRPCLPGQVQNRQAFDYVEEALENYVFRAPTSNPLPPAFGPARKIADKLQDLASEAEKMAQDVHRERVAEAPATPSNSLEASLGELRAIRQAEDELRQNLRA